MNAEKQITKTEAARMRADLVEMLDAISFADGHTTVASTIDAVCRDVIECRFNALPDAIKQRAIARIEALSKG